MYANEEKKPAAARIAVRVASGPGYLEHNSVKKCYLPPYRIVDLFFSQCFPLSATLCDIKSVYDIFINKNVVCLFVLCALLYPVHPFAMKLYEVFE